MFSTRLRAALPLFFALCAAAPLRAEDWGKIEAEYRALKSALETQGEQRGPDHYAVPTPGGALVFDARPEFGIGIHQPTAESLEVLGETGVRFVRYTVYWYEIETTDAPGVYDEAALERYDDAFRRMTDMGFIPVALLHGNPPGVSFADRGAGYERFADFLAFCGKRWPRVHYFELWNEMDGAFTDLFGAGATDANGAEIPLRQRGRYYAEMLKLAYPALKEVRPDAVVVTGGMTDWGEFPKGIYEGGGRPHFDVMNLHTYGMPLTWSFVQRGYAVRELMDQMGDAGKPLWNTEFGLDAGSLVQAWGLPQGDAGAYFDKQQLDQVRECLEFNRKAKLYQKTFAYQWDAGNEGEKERLEQAIRDKTLVLPKGRTLDDYGFGFRRADGKTLRPAMQWIVNSNYNDPARLGRAISVWLTPSEPGGPASVPVGSAYPTFVAAGHRDIPPHPSEDME